MNYQKEIDDLCLNCKKDKNYIDTYIKTKSFNKKDIIQLIKSFLGEDGIIGIEHNYVKFVFVFNDSTNILSEYEYKKIICYDDNKNKKVYYYNGLSLSILIKLFKYLFQYYYFCCNR